MKGWLVALVLVAACSESIDKPIEPVWGKQPCDHCAMILSDARFAAESASADGVRRYFDDIGCLMAYLREHPEAGARAWVRLGNEWAPAASAHYHTGARSPMDYGLIADANGLSFTQAQAWVEAKRKGEGDAR
jgi:copper chaperone NosL